MKTTNKPKNAARQPQSPILLRSGRLVIHTIDRDNTQFATPTPGPEEMTETEWDDYCAKLTAAMRKEGSRRLS